MVPRNGGDVDLDLEDLLGGMFSGRRHHPLPWITSAGDDSFADIVDAARIPVLVDLWATWCAPCRVVSPALEQVARDLAGSVKLAKVDVDAAPRTAARFAVQAVPTLLVMSGGEVKARRAGAAPAASIRDSVTDTIAATGGSGR